MSGGGGGGGFFPPINLAKSIPHPHPHTHTYKYNHQCPPGRINRQQSLDTTAVADYLRATEILDQTVIITCGTILRGSCRILREINFVNLLQSGFRLYAEVVPIYKMDSEGNNFFKFIAVRFTKMLILNGGFSVQRLLNMLETFKFSYFSFFF